MKRTKIRFKILSVIMALSMLLGPAYQVLGFLADTTEPPVTTITEDQVPSPEEETVAQSEPVTTEYRNLSLTPGSNVEEMHFTWHSGFEDTMLVIENPNGTNWELVSEGRPAVAHGGIGVMGANSNLLPTRPGYTYYVHQVAAYGLNKDTTYTYFIACTEGNWRTGDKTFRTGGRDHFQFLIAGDPQIGTGDGLQPTNTTEAAVDGTNWINTLDIAIAAYPESDFILSVGDQIHSSNSIASDPNDHVAISQFRHDRLFSNAHLQSLPLLAVIGNHDGWTFDNNNANIRLWPMHYNIPAPDQVGTRGGIEGGRYENVFRHRGDMYTQFDYWVRWGDVLFFVLDSNGANDGQHRVMTGERLRFLEDAVAQNADATWRVATFHHPAYSVYRMSGIQEIQQIINNFLPVFERLEFDLILNGHAHVYSRSHHMLGNAPQFEQQFIDADGNIVSERTHAVLDPVGIAHIDFNSSSGSGFYNVAAMPRSYIATYNQNFRRNFSVADVTAHTFSVRTYQIDDNDGSRSLVDVYTIVRSDENNNVPAEVTHIPQMDDQTFERITQPEGVSVPHGTPATAEDFGLPVDVGIETNLFNNVGGNLDNVRPPNAAAAPYSYGLVVRTPRADVEWDIENADFDPDETALQTFYVRGTVNDLPDGIIQIGNGPLYVYIEVTILPYGIVMPGDIARWMQADGMEAYFLAQGGMNARVSAVQPTYGYASPLQFFVGENTRYFHWNAGAPTVTNAAGTGPGGLNNLTEPAFWQTSFSTLGRAHIEVAFDFRSDPAGTGNNNNGPRDWQLEFSFNNEDWAPAGLPVILTGVWNANIVRTLPEVANDQPIVYLRWRMTSDVAVGGGAISATARNHMRNITIRSTRPLHGGGDFDGYQRIDVLMFNDFHGHVEAAEPVPENPGAARLAAFVEYQRLQNPNPNNVIVVSGGDEFHGYAVSTLTNGNPTLALMEYLAANSPTQVESGIHVALGNHEFSFGYNRAREIGHHPGVTLLAADLYYAPNRPGTRPDFVEPYDIIEFPDHDFSVALVGLMTSNMENVVSGWGTLGLEARTPAPGNPNEYTQALATLISYLREERGVHAVIAVTHMGGNHASTTYIAQNLDFDGIVSGHVHTRVHRRVNDTPIIEAAHAGRALGRFSLVFDEAGDLMRVDSWLSEAGAIEHFTRQAAVVSGVGHHYDAVTALMQPFFDDTYEELRGPRGPHGVYFSNRAERDMWASRLVLDYVTIWATEADEAGDWIGISNGGGWRNTGFWPRNATDPTTMAELISTMPFDNNILLFSMHGQDVLSLINATGLTGTQVRAGIHQEDGNWYVTASGERILNDRTQVFNVIGSNFIFGGIGATGGDNYPWPGNVRGNQMGMQVLDPDGPRVIMQNGDTISWNELLDMSTAPADWEGLGVSMIRNALLASTTFRDVTPNSAWQAELNVIASNGGDATIAFPFAPGDRTRNVNIAPQWVTVTATSAPGYDFVGWFESGDEALLSETLTYSFTITADTTLEARFTSGEPAEPKQVTIAAWANQALGASHGYPAITGANSFDPRWSADYGLASSPGNARLNFVDNSGSRTLAVGSGGITAGNALAQGYYWLTEISTTNLEDIQIEWNFRSTTTGPRDFQLQYRVAGGAWSDAGEPIVMPNIANPTTINAAPHFMRTLPESAENQARVELRWIITSNYAVNPTANGANGPGTIATGGTNQIGNILITGMVAEAGTSALTVEEARAAETGETITVRGIATTNYAPGASGNAFFLQSPTGMTPESGILVRVTGATATQLAAFAGREVEVTGVRNGNVTGNGFVGLENITVAALADINNIGQATLPEAVPVTFDQLRDRQFQSMLVTTALPVEIMGSTTGAGGDPNRVINVPGGGNFVLWQDPVAGAFAVGDQVIINRGVIHWWDARDEVQFRIINPATDLALYGDDGGGEPGDVALTVTLTSFADFHGMMTSENSVSDPGFARFVSFVNAYQERVEDETGHRPVLLHAGDTFFGQSINNLMWGEPSLRVLNHLGVRYGAVGNHEFSWQNRLLTESFGEADPARRAELLAAVDRNVNPIWETLPTDHPLNIVEGGIPFLAADVVYEAGHPREGAHPDWLQPYAILSDWYEDYGVSVALIGLTHPNMASLVGPMDRAGLNFRTPRLVQGEEVNFEWLEEMITMLRDPEGPYGVNAVVAVTHTSHGNYSNMIVDGLLQRGHAHFDGFFAGHTHGTANTVRTYGDLRTAIVLGAHHGRGAGDIQLGFDDEGELVYLQGNLMSNVRPYAPDPEVFEWVHGVGATWTQTGTGNNINLEINNQPSLDGDRSYWGWEQVRDYWWGRPVGPRVTYATGSGHHRNQFLVNLLYDYVMREHADDLALTTGEPFAGTVIINNQSAWRGQGVDELTWEPDHQVNTAQLMAALTFENTMPLFEIRGRDLIEMLNMPGANRGAGETNTPQTPGRITDSNSPLYGRPNWFTMQGSTVTGAFYQDGVWYMASTLEPISLDGVYRLGASNHLFGGFGQNGGQHWPLPGNNHGNALGFEVIDFMDQVYDVPYEHGPRFAIRDTATDTHITIQETWLRETAHRATLAEEGESLAAWIEVEAVGAGNAELAIWGLGTRAFPGASNHSGWGMPAYGATSNTTRDLVLNGSVVRAVATVDVASDDVFLGWFADDVLVFSDEVFIFNAEIDLTLEARFGEETALICEVVVAGSFVGAAGSVWRICDDGTLEIDEGVINWTGALSPWHAHRDLITSIEITGAITAGSSLRALFRELTFVTEINGLTYFDTSATTSMYRMFFGLSGVTELDVTNFATDQVTNMALMFRDASSLVELDVSNFNTGNVTDMREMFRGTSIEVLDLSGFDTSSVTNMNHMFTALHTLRTLTLGESFSFIGTPNLVPIRQTESDTGLWQGEGIALTSAQLMAQFDGNTMAGTFVRQTWTEADPEICEIMSRGRFANGTHIGGAQWHLCDDGTLEVGSGFINWTLVTSPWHANRADITEIVFTGEVLAGPSLRSLFHDLHNLEEIHNLAYLDTSQVANMARMFRGASSLTDLDLSTFDTGNVTDMSWMFFGASGLETLDVTHFVTNHVTDMALMFRETSSLTELDVSNFDTSSVTDMREMFRGMSSLTILDLDNFDTTGVMNMNHMFVGMSALTELILGDLFTPIGSPGIPRLH